MMKKPIFSLKRTHLREQVHQKHLQADDVLVCYCYQHTPGSIRGLVAGVVAFVACHLPLTLPLLVTLTAGTAVGGWLAHNSILIYALSTLLFIGGLGLAWKWLTVAKTEVCPIDELSTGEQNEKF